MWNFTLVAEINKLELTKMGIVHLMWSSPPLSFKLFNQWDSLLAKKNLSIIFFSEYEIVILLVL